MSNGGAGNARPTVADLLKSAAAQGLRLTTEQEEPDESGLDFVVVVGQDESGAEWIVRRPRRPSVLDAAHSEARALELVRPRLPVAVPHWRVFSDEVIAYPRLPGKPAVTIDPQRGTCWNGLDPAAPSDAFLDSLAAALAALHGVPIEAARAAALPSLSSTDDRSLLGAAMRATRDVLAPSERLWRRWQAWLDSDGLWPPHVVLVHGDLHPGHWLLDETGRLTGLLDWTTARVAEPGTDFALVYGCLGEAGLRPLVQRYQRAGGRTWPGLLAHSRERWAAFPAVAAEYALQMQSPTVLEHARGLLAAAEAET